MFTVYKATSPSNKVYIGITSKSLARRKIQHLSAAASKSDFTFHRALRKYGSQMVWETVALVLSWNEAKELEKSLIVQFDSFKSGYNMTLGGDGQLGQSFSHTQETKDQISKNNGRFWAGKPRSEETKHKISLKQKGVTRGPLSEETKKKLSNQKLGDKNPMFGKHPINFKSRPRCLDCGDQLVARIAKRCKSCAQLFRRQVERAA